MTPIPVTPVAGKQTCISTGCLLYNPQTKNSRGREKGGQPLSNYVLSLKHSPQMDMICVSNVQNLNQGILKQRTCALSSLCLQVSLPYRQIPFPASVLTPALAPCIFGLTFGLDRGRIVATFAFSAHGGATQLLRIVQNRTAMSFLHVAMR